MCTSGTPLSNTLVNSSTSTVTINSTTPGAIGSSYPMNSGQWTYTPIRQTYNILGEEVESDGYGDANISIIIAMINTVGIKYYGELKKQRVTIHGKIGEFLETQLKSYYRDNKIDEVVNDTE